MAMAVIYTFRGILELRGALHIGSGAGDERTDAAVVRDARGQPYIPGSSLRGAFRAAVERLAPALLGLAPVREMAELNYLDNLLEGRSEQAIQAQLNEELTSVERLFGTTYWASPLTIPDLPLISGEQAAGEIRHGVGIDRDTGAAREQIKYDFEVLPRDHTFRLTMRCEMERAHEPTWSRILAIGLRLLEQGEIALGGRVARGAGQVQLTGLEVYTLDTDDRAALRAALLAAPEDTARYGRQLPPGWVTRTLEQM
jgi:CRISPR-associated RAMP protein (TIGR02581 family)